MRRGNEITLPPTASPDSLALAREVQRVLDDMRNSPQELVSIPVADLLNLSAAKWINCAVVVPDESGGRTIATSDGTAWKRCKDGATVT